VAGKASDDKALVAQLPEGDDLRFGFGANWAAYIKQHFSDDRVEISQRHLLRVLKLDDLKGRTFLDVGCGSGLHSLAAWRGGADRVVSFDFDADSVRTAQYLHRMNGSPHNWTILQGSVLDKAFVEQLPKSDIVYSWGVLHHTGSMWTAFTNAASRVNGDGVFYVALYSSDACTDPPASYWMEVKRAYNNAGTIMKRWMEWRYAWNHSIRRDLLALRNPLTYIREYKKERGMSFWHDVRDWLGGYPMEYAGHRETRELGSRLGLELLFVKAGEANTEFVFRPAGAANYWDHRFVDAPLRDIPGPFVNISGHAWRALLATSALGEPARLMLYEDGVPLGWPGQTADMIGRWGSGRYGVDSNGLVFSASDGGDPNGRQYQFRIDFA